MALRPEKSTSRIADNVSRLLGGILVVCGIGLIAVSMDAEQLSAEAEQASAQSGATATDPVAPSLDPVRAGAQIQQCVVTAAGSVPSRSDTPVPLRLSQTAADWSRLLSLSVNSAGADPAQLVAAVCGALSSASKQALAKLGPESLALSTLESSTAAAARARIGQQLLAAQQGQERAWTAAIDRYLSQLLHQPAGIVFIAALIVVFAGVLVLAFRMAAVQRKLTLIDRSVRYGSLSAQSKQTTHARRVLDSAKALAEEGIYVAAADVELEADPKMIVLTVANATQAPKRATAYFSFFNAEEEKVGDHQTSPFTVPPEGIYNLRTAVPANDGSWIKWRSEIRPA